MSPLPFESMDAVALQSSEYREVRAIIRDLKPDCRKPIEQVLLNLGYPEEIVDAALYDHAEEAYDALTYAEQEERGFRFWLDETRGCRL